MSEIFHIISRWNAKRTLNAFIDDEKNSSLVDSYWVNLSSDYQNHYHAYPDQKMVREELSFHDQVKLLAYLLLFIDEKLKGDNLEIGVWKGKSLALIESFSIKGRSYGIDYCAFPNQIDEIKYFQKRFFPDAKIIMKSSELATAEVFQSVLSLKLLHIDGGHERDNVWSDFLIYNQLVEPGGFVVFDDYVDPLSPNVGPAVDELKLRGYFRDYQVIGQLHAFPSSYVLRKKC